MKISALVENNGRFGAQPKNILRFYFFKEDFYEIEKK
jgi:hypothetical protein